ncbi:hypothetical protein K504DRAFT_416081 [Pleomassaria siparia CBS 279.74]|uniref:Uncharacterized protein n=1 Tax=Pleomassaria siparia CBS 279.74 TaxID=1314801 RepID=A0A6G1JX86_9PLEO|nr:hypothetical protein K504DRAFT_416081 [Pleomassaria siparia CBS 279.74]
MGVTPIAHPVTTPWDIPISYTDYNEIMKGFEPESMEDKWLCRTDKPNAQGNAFLHLYRSWTQEEQLCLTIKTGDISDTKANDWAKITTISWDTGEEGTEPTVEEEAKQMALNLCKYLVGRAI